MSPGPRSGPKFIPATVPGRCEKNPEPHTLRRDLFDRDVTRGFSMLNTLIRARSAAVVTTATTAKTLILRRNAGCADRRWRRVAMEVLFARHRTHVYRWLLRFVSDETLAEDLLSDVFLDVWRQAGRFEFRSSVSTWLLSIARYKALGASPPERCRLDDETVCTIADTADDRSRAAEQEPWRVAAPGADPSVARASCGHRSRLLSRKESKTSANSRSAAGSRQNTHVLCPPQIGRVGTGA